MITEYSTYEDIRKLRDKAFAKYNEMKKGWLGKEARRAMIKWRRNTKFYTPIVKKFKVDNQILTLEILPAMYENGSLYKTDFGFHLTTYIETNNGRVYYGFTLHPMQIHIYTPHYVKRNRERNTLRYLSDVICTDIVPYDRKGKRYELRICHDSVMITERPEEDIVRYITYLDYNGCTNNMNYQELFARAGQAIDEQDIYQWREKLPYNETTK
jgi:hypothetical protein